MTADSEPTETQGATARQSTRRLRAAERRYEVYDLALAGFTQRTIAGRYGVSQRTIWDDIRYVAEERRKLGLQSTDQHRQLMLDRLTRLLSSVWQRATSGTNDAALRNADRLLRTMIMALTLGEGLKVTVTHQLREIADAGGMDARELIAEVERMLADEGARQRRSRP
jgi:transposase